jgi:hypothetical protein
MLKTCSKCKKEKNISEFNKRSDRNAYRSHCKACVKIYLQLQDPRKIKLQRKNYNLKNKNKMNEWARNKHDATNGHYSRIKYQVRKAILTGIIKKQIVFIKMKDALDKFKHIIMTIQNLLM